MGQSKLRARRFGGRRIMAPAVYQTAEILWIVPMAVARHLQQSTIPIEPTFRTTANALNAAARLAGLHHAEQSHVIPAPAPNTADDSLYARIDPATFVIVETLTDTDLSGLTPLADGYRYARPSGSPIDVAVRADTPTVSNAVLTGGDEVSDLPTLLTGKIRSIGSVTMASSDPLLLQMSLLATLQHAPASVVDGHSAHIALAAADLKARASTLSPLRAADYWIYRLLTQREITGNHLGIDATKPIDELLVAIDTALHRNAEVMPDYPELRALCAALQQPISAFRLREYDDKREWDVFEEVLDAVMPGELIGSPAARTFLPLAKAGADDLVERLTAHLTTLSMQAERTFIAHHNVRIFDDGEARFLVITHEGDSIDLITWIKPLPDPALSAASTVQADALETA